MVSWCCWVCVCSRSLACTSTVCPWFSWCTRCASPYFRATHFKETGPISGLDFARLTWGGSCEPAARRKTQAYPRSKGRPPNRPAAANSRSAGPPSSAPPKGKRRVDLSQKNGNSRALSLSAACHHQESRNARGTKFARWESAFRDRRDRQIFSQSHGEASYLDCQCEALKKSWLCLTSCEPYLCLRI